MRSPTLALTWYLWRPHRWSVTVLVGLLLVLAALQQVVPIGRFHELVALASGASLLLGVTFAVAIFTMGHESDYVKKSSSFPRCLFGLPVRTSTLVFWPMLQGMLFVALLWIAWVQLSLLPEGKAAPIWWPALMLAALLGCIQAVAWWPCESPLLRVVLTVVWSSILAAMAAGLFGLIQGKPGAWYGEVANAAWLASLFGALIPASYVAALAGVMRARRGDNSGWAWLSRQPTLAAERLPRMRRPFSSPEHAQLWIECRRNGTLLPLATTWILVFYVVVVLWQPDLPWTALVKPLLFLQVLALIIGGYLGKEDFWVQNPRLTAFAATRPINNAAFIVAKLKMTALSTLATWGIVFVVMSLLLVCRGDSAEIVRAWNRFAQEYGSLKAAVLLAVAPVGLLGFTWLMMIRGLWVCLTGQPWVGVTTTFIVSGLVAVPFALSHLFQIHPKEYLWSLDVLTWLAGLAVLGKLVVTGSLVRALRRGTLIATRVLVRILAAWFLCVVSLFVLSAWLVPDEMVPRFLLALGSVLVLPLASLLAAPLALTWNRHR